MRLKGFVLSGMLLLLLSFVGFSQVQTARNVSMTPNSDGYLEYLPEGYNTGNQTYPLILFIHGMGELGNVPLSNLMWGGLPGLINQGGFPNSFTVNGQTSRFIVISPHFNPDWPVPNDINEILDYLVSHYRVDQTRIYMTGLSMGGGVTWDYAGGSSVYANRLAAIVPIAGASWPEPIRGRVIANANLAVWATHNNGDGVVPVSYTNDYIANINAAPSPNPLAKKSIFISTDHDAWTHTYDPTWKEDGVMNIYQWMLQYSRSTAGPNPNQAPAANAGPNQTIALPTSAVTLTGSGTDADGTIASYAWIQTNGTAATITSPSSASTTITGLTSTGSRTFRLTVTDDKGASGISYVTITVNPAPKAIPGRLEAENWDAKSGSQYGVPTNDPNGGGQHVIGLSNGTWMDYNVNVATAGAYTVSFRVATTQSSSQYQLKSGNTVLVTFNVPNTGGWSSWATASVTATLPAGDQTLRIISTSNESSNLNWVDFALAVTSTAPAANAGPAQTIILPTNQVTLSGSGTANNGGSITSHVWTKLSGGSATITSPSNYGSTVTGLSAGTYTYRLTVTQNDNQTATSDVIITVNNPGPPTANAGAAQAITLPISQVSLTGSGTAGNGGSISYAWTQVSGTAATITNPLLASTTVTGLTTAGTRVFRLTVTQSDNQTATNDVTITVNSATAPPANGKTIPGKIEAESFDTKSGGMYGVPTTDAGGGQHVIGISNGSWMDYNVTVTQSGTYTVSFRIATTQSNSQFQIKLGAAVLATVSIPNTAGWDTWVTVPVNNISLTAGVQTIRIISTNNETCNFNWMDWALTTTSTAPAANAGPAQTIISPTNQVTLSGSGVANNGGSITSHVWTKLSGGSATITSPSNYGSTVTGLSAGTYTFRLTVTQNDNQTATSDVIITVNNPGPPTANAGAAQTITLPISQVSLTGSGTAGNGGAISYAWTQVSGTAATITNPLLASTTVTGLTTAGIRVFRLTVTQSDNQTATNDVTITVNSATAPPTNGKTIPGKIEAESFDTKSGGMYGVSTTDAGGGLQVIGISNGSWMDYNVTVTQSGTYTVNFRIATTQNNSQFQIKLGATVLATVNIPNTLGWGNWVTVPVNNVSLAAGVQTLRILSTNNETCNFNWMDFALSNQAIVNSIPVTSDAISMRAQNTLPVVEPATNSSFIAIFPNPVQDQFVLRSNNNYEGAMKIQIIDANGKVAKEMQATKNKGKGEIYLSVNGIAPGTYIVRVQMGEWIKSIKMIKH